MKGIIFDIKEFSIHDGPGGRTTVFMKGCYLRCRWCHNPEGLVSELQVLKNHNLCTHCGMCKIPCNHSECEPFDVCIHTCPNGCLSVSGKEVDSAELAEKLKKDKQIYESLNGGITVSGGEPMIQADFVCDLADNLNGIHKAIQTSGYTDEETYKRVISKFDYIMQDIKLINENEHIKYTGVSNKIILENIEKLKQSGKEFVFRVPLIPDITDVKENLDAIKELTKGYNVEYLPYNTMAGAKYDMLGMKYQLDKI